MVAPELFGEVIDGDRSVHCYVKRQPQTEHEHALMLETMAAAELACIRYRGREFKRQKTLVRVVPTLMDHINPGLLHRYLIGHLKAKWAIFKWRLQNRKAINGRK